jgi:hypothetical protein
MTIEAVRCRGCGGAIAMSAGKSVPACLFCGEAALEPMQEIPEVPDRHIPFAIDAEAALASFRRFASSSFWYPSEIRHARVELRRVYLPGWTWSGRVDSTFNAIVQRGAGAGIERREPRRAAGNLAVLHRACRGLR